MKYSPIIAFIFLSTVALAQEAPPSNWNVVSKADSLYQIKKYKEAAIQFTKQCNDKSLKDFKVNYCYGAACSWALAGVNDSAFSSLNYLLLNMKNEDPDFLLPVYEQISKDADLTALKKDKRWQELVQNTETIRKRVEAELNKPLIAELKNIYDEDQGYRKMIYPMLMDSSVKKDAKSRNELKKLLMEMQKGDSLHLVRVEYILNTFGWLGRDKLGQRASSTLWIVIQHSNLEVQEKYLPMMKEAVKNGNALESELNLLLARIEENKSKSNK